MTQVQMLESQIKKLARPKLAMFREWFLQYDAEAWDRQIRKDGRSGKLAKLARRALDAYRAGKTREL